MSVNKIVLDSVIAVAETSALTDKAVYQGISDDKNRNLTSLLISHSYESNPEAL
ncbi:MAG: hypothetical protein ACI8UX_001324 [Psychromonas sp.]|jgi:hypothetical protein